MSVDLRLPATPAPVAEEVRAGDAPSVLHLVADAVARHPEETALAGHGPAVTYRELWQRAGAIAVRLRGEGIGPGDVVGLAALRSTELVVALIGVLRSGAAFLPLDSGYPRARLEHMLDDARVGVVLGHAETAERFAEGRTVLLLGEEQAARPLTPAAESLLPPLPAAEDLAYVLYTSGTTGAPKGIAMPHGALANIVEWQTGVSEASVGSRTLQFSAISFDVSFQEIFASLAVGGTVVCVTEEERRDPLRLWEAAARERVDRMFLPYVALQALVLVAEPGAAGAPPLREVVTAGEQLQCSRALRALLGSLPGCRLVNQYGPSEAHVVTWHPVEGDPDGWPALPPIGLPVPGNRVYVLDADGEEVPPGGIGDIHVGGVQVAYGYWNRPDLTAERFLPEPGRPGRRMYRTGDVARRRKDGSLDYLGRADDQVKIRGFRLELPEVERVLGDLPGVSSCAVAVRGEDGIEKTLVAFVVLEPGLGTSALASLRTDLAELLPDYMVPGRFRAVTELPTMPNGKMDRPRLRAMAENAE
ncbi:amino acid adenylation domain-containing protein [Streptomyces filamentosus]|uniref:amino acid adenylation domain-containing protein n=1 Tax=Streptomyces filamentosus TaxID=67294 RepID=UPI00123BF8A0|nr:amino acid adenylation domain-containing protein [Streptomyces filamentosus]KAA6211594.1 amino acid adenylation domain-containing protein [Streptomyces filamentosus]